MPAAPEYALPEDAVASAAAEPRTATKLLVDAGPGGTPTHRTLGDVPDLVREGDLLVVNEARAAPTRLRLRAPAGAPVEVVLLDPVPGEAGDWDALVRPGPSAPEGTLLVGDRSLEVAVGERLDGGRRRVRILGADPVAALEQHGRAELPPYLAGLRVDADRPVSTTVAGPSGGWRGTEGGLHLEADLLEACRRRGAAVASVELVVSGAPTAATEDAELPAERYRVPAETLRAATAARRVLAVGVPSARALEAAATTNRLAGETRLLVVPGHPWRVVDAVLTTFAAPRSAALLLVEALIGPRWHALYGIGLAAGYRFGPLGDAVLLQRAPAPA